MTHSNMVLANLLRKSPPSTRSSLIWNLSVAIFSLNRHCVTCRGKWAETQDNLKLTVYRNIYGIHAPVRLLMERKAVAFVRSLPSFQSLLITVEKNPHMPALPQSNLHLDILMGRDETIEPVDVFFGE